MKNSSTCGIDYCNVTVDLSITFPMQYQLLALPPRENVSATEEQSNNSLWSSNTNIALLFFVFYQTSQEQLKKLSLAMKNSIIC